MGKISKKRGEFSNFALIPKKGCEGFLLDSEIVK
jgi:hypothetical protein